MDGFVGVGWEEGVREGQAQKAKMQQWKLLGQEFYDQQAAE